MMRVFFPFKLNFADWTHTLQGCTRTYTGTDTRWPCRTTVVEVASAASNSSPKVSVAYFAKYASLIAMKH